MGRLAAEIGDSLPAVTGVIHGAGAVADRRIDGKSVPDFFRVLTVKAGAAALLQERLPAAGLRFWLNLSSIASFFSWYREKIGSKSMASQHTPWYSRSLTEP